MVAAEGHRMSERILMTTTYDAIIIGTGQAGPFLAQRLTTSGMKVAIIERKLFGGTCVNTGCIPTKTMVASAYAAHMARRAADFGVDTAGVSVDMKRVKARKDEVSGQSRTGLEAWLKKMENCTVYEGQAHFEAPREVAVGSERLTAERIFINVGGRAATPQMPGLEQVEYLTNSSMMNVDFLPKHSLLWEAATSVWNSDKCSAVLAVKSRLSRWPVASSSVKTKTCR
jgi:pyruvate/2-oxoglutarate dehydrogenase complex dihydrolipoamide dehydrogenase (E3) component